MVLALKNDYYYILHHICVFIFFCVQELCVTLVRLKESRWVKFHFLLGTTVYIQISESRESDLDNNEAVAGCALPFV